MNTLVFKLILTPTLIGAVSFAGRRWGPGVSGWLVGLPLTSGPVALFLALEQGRAFASAAATGILAGTLSVAAFCLAYSWLAFRLSWPLTALASLLLFAAATWMLQQIAMPLVLVFVGVVAFLVIALRLLPDRTGLHAIAMPPWWDIPARMLIATAFVFLLTGLAPALGPRLSGLLAPFPIYATTLGVFTHHFQGAAATAHLLRGVVLGLFSFAGFFLVVAALIEHTEIVGTFAGATIVALNIQGASLWVLRRPVKAEVPRNAV
jgi:hypothetical protein